MRTSTFLTVAIASILINVTYASGAELNKRLGEGLVPDLSGATGAAGGSLSVVTSALDGDTGDSQQLKISRRRRKRGLPVVDSLVGGSGGLPVVGSVFGGSGSTNGKDQVQEQGAGAGKGNKNGGGDRKVDEDSKQPEYKLASTTTTGSGLPLVGSLGVLGKRSSFKAKRDTGFPETVDTVGKTVLVFDAADAVANTAAKAVTL